MTLRFKKNFSGKKMKRKAKSHCIPFPVGEELNDSLNPRQKSLFVHSSNETKNFLCQVQVQRRKVAKKINCTNI